MRLKQLSGILALLLVATTVAAATSQLTDVAVQSKDATTTVTIRANGTFSHTEYRPTDNLLLVDLAGVSAAKLESQTRELREHPGVHAYRVLGYKGSNGGSTTRVEITLAPNAQVNIAEAKNAVSVRVTADKLAAAAAPAVAKP